MSDSELKALMLLALKNAFYQDFSALVNQYLIASEGLVSESFMASQFSEMTSVYGRDPKLKEGQPLNIWANVGHQRTRGYSSLLEALQDDEAYTVNLQGSKIFERRVNNWLFVGEK